MKRITTNRKALSFISNCCNFLSIYWFFATNGAVSLRKRLRPIAVEINPRGNGGLCVLTIVCVYGKVSGSKSKTHHLCLRSFGNLDGHGLSPAVKSKIG